MGKVNKEQRLRVEGMNYALRIAKDKGIEELESECIFRGNYNIPLTISKEKIKEVQELIQKTTIETVMLMAAAVLRDEFGFGEKRLNQFLDRFALKTACLCSGEASWDDLIEQMKEEVGIDLDITGIVSGRRCDEAVEKQRKRLEELAG